ncbi:MAG: hypothetical protein H7101_03870, partial [Deinococcales bacterium]|nr:hypothetical protein [Chitinophagaceae bacterium]
KTTVALNSGTYQYRYFLSDGRWVNDTNADKYTHSEGFFVDNCVITVPEEASKAVKAKNETPVTVVETVPVATKAVTKKVAVATAEPIKKATKAKKETAAPVIEVAAPAKKAATKATKAKK